MLSYAGRSSSFKGSQETEGSLSLLIFLGGLERWHYDWWKALKLQLPRQKGIQEIGEVVVIVKWDMRRGEEEAIRQGDAKQEQAKDMSGGGEGGSKISENNVESTRAIELGDAR